MNTWRKKLRNWVVMSLAAFVTVSSFSGCSGGNGAKSSSNATLSVWVYGWEKGSADAMKKDAIEYKKKTGVTINIIPVASDSYSTKVQATLAGGNNPDVSIIDAGMMSTQLAAKGKLLDLSKYGVDKYKSDFYSSVWDTLAYKGKTYGLRITANNLALFYNKKLFDAAKLAYPTNDWTWDDLRTAAKKLTDAKKGVFGLDLPIYNSDGGYTWTWLPFLWQAGGTMLNEDRTKATFNSPEGVKALEFWKDMVQADKSCPLQAAPSGVNRFTSGLTAMTIDGPWNLETFLADPKFKDSFGVAYLPKDKTQATVVGGEGFVAYSNTKYPQQAYDYIVHVTMSDFKETFWNNWYTIPPQPKYADFYKNNAELGKYIQVFSDQMAIAKTRQFTPTWPQIVNTMGLGLQDYMFGKTSDAQQALDNTAKEVDKILQNG